MSKVEIGVVLVEESDEESTTAVFFVVVDVSGEDSTTTDDDFLAYSTTIFEDEEEEEEEDLDLDLDLDFGMGLGIGLGFVQTRRPRRLLRLIIRVFLKTSRTVGVVGGLGVGVGVGVGIGMMEEIMAKGTRMTVASAVEPMDAHLIIDLTVTVKAVNAALLQSLHCRCRGQREEEGNRTMIERQREKERESKERRKLGKKSLRLSDSDSDSDSNSNSHIDKSLTPTCLSKLASTVIFKIYIWWANFLKIYPAKSAPKTLKNN